MLANMTALAHIQIYLTRKAYSTGVTLVMYETIQHDTEQEKKQYKSTTYLYAVHSQITKCLQQQLIGISW